MVMAWEATYRVSSRSWHVMLHFYSNSPQFILVLLLYPYTTDHLAVASQPEELIYD